MKTNMKTSIANLIRLSIGRPVMGLAVFFLSLPAQAQQFVPQLLPQPARIEIRKSEYLKLKHPADSAWMKNLSYSYDTALPPEGYVVDVTEKGISIKAHDASGYIEDAPRYAWRGCMIDVSRHFFPISFLKKQPIPYR